MDKIWTGRRRLETPERPEMIGKPAPLVYWGKHSRHPEKIRVSFDDGSTEVYDIHVEQPNPVIMDAKQMIEVNQKIRRRRGK